MALTFDDGPSAEWTPKILDILKQKGVKATFFIVGDNGETNPSLVQRILAEGHEIGNHTFTHPNLGEVSTEVARLEINATQRLVEALTGRSMRLFRPPFFGDAEPTTPSEIAPVKLAQSLGYVTVGLRVDPDDWQGPSADLIVQRILDRMADTNPETRGQIVLLHDAGGDRSHTVAALPRIIDALRAKGLEIVPVSALAGWTFDQVMPPCRRRTTPHSSTGTCSSLRAGCKPLCIGCSRSPSPSGSRASSRSAAWPYGAATKPLLHRRFRLATASPFPF